MYASRNEPARRYGRKVARIRGKCVCKKSSIELGKKVRKKSSKEIGNCVCMKSSEQLLKCV